MRERFRSKSRRASSQPATQTPPPAPVGDADAELFRDAIGSVRRLEPVAIIPGPRKPRPRPLMHAADEALALHQSQHVSQRELDAEGADPLSYRRPEVPGRVLKRLRRGEYAAQGEIDLHNLSAAGAEALLREFLAQSRDDGQHCVRVIHGKGLHSPTGEPVLKRLVDRLLSQRADVLAYASAPAAQGGTGATLVLLKKR